MNDLAFLQIQVLELQRLLEGAGDDPIMVPLRASALRNP